MVDGGGYGDPVPVGETGERVGRPERVAVVVASRDRPAMLRGALEAVLDAVGPDDEVVVVDSASMSGETGAVAEDAGVRCIRCDLPGLARARNAGVAATSAEVVAFTDDDCRPRRDWVDATWEAFDTPEVGFVAGRVMPEEQLDAGFAVSVKTDTASRRFVGRADPTDIGHGANFAARRATIEDVRGFDELLGAGGRFRAGEDSDFFHRALRAGWHGVFTPESVVTHRQWRSRQEAIRLQYGYGLGAGAFAVKALKLAPSEGLRILGEQLGRHGVGQLGHDLRIRYKTGTAMSAVRVAGTVVGAARASRIRVREGRFAARASTAPISGRQG